MARKILLDAFIEHLQQQLTYLRDEEYGYRALQLHVSGIAQPWIFQAHDEFEFHEETGVLIVRDGPTDEDGHDNAV